MDISHTPEPSSGGPSSRVTLSLRGQRLTLERNALMEMPESVLLCLFPNGVVLSAPMQGRGEWDDVEGGEGEEAEEVYPVDFDGPCLQYILNFFAKARLDFYGPPESPKRPYKDFSEPNPLFHKQAIIVLREELEYFAIPPKRQAGDETAKEEDEPKTDADGLPNEKLLELKRDCGEALLERRSIFTALQRNVNRENNVAEQHLIDMLCMSGFDRSDLWGYRAMEPSRCCITSIALVLLKTGIGEPGSAAEGGEGTAPTEGSQQGGEGEPSVNAAQLATAQKLLLFWRKPARKCWWDATDITIPRTDKTIKVWARRVWTLELSLI